jgi:hypothetical protein
MRFTLKLARVLFAVALLTGIAVAVWWMGEHYEYAALNNGG